MLQYFWYRVKADSNGWGLHPTNENRHDGSAWSSPVHEYEHAGFGFVPTSPAANVLTYGCGPHFQLYEGFRDLRCRAQCLFKPRERLRMANSTNFQTLGPNDVVIHYREPFELMHSGISRRVGGLVKNKTHPPFGAPPPQVIPHRDASHASKRQPPMFTFVARFLDFDHGLANLITSQSTLTGY